MAGLILDQGLVQAANEIDLDRLAIAAFEDYRSRKYHTVWWEIFNKDHKIPPPTAAANNKPVNSIRFLGLWDTVAAYGLPIDEMTRGVSKWIWPLELPNRVLDPRVQRACHALALDDERTTFHPVLWDESTQIPAGPDQPPTKLVSRLPVFLQSCVLRRRGTGLDLLWRRAFFDDQSPEDLGGDRLGESTPPNRGKEAAPPCRMERLSSE